MRNFYFLIIASLFISCGAGVPEDGAITENNEVVTDTIPKEVPLYCNHEVVVGAEMFENYYQMCEGKTVAIVANQSSLVGKVHLVDTLRSKGLSIEKIFSPEHGFRGDADAGEKVKDGIDPVTGLSVISLYGKNKKPTAEQLKNVDVILFDIQDVGARFYTYISTLTYVMEAAAENDKMMIVLDRPNPNGHYVDGPVLKAGFSSFVGMHEVPVVHGMTIGEYAQMVNEEGWLKNGVKCDLHVSKCKGWDHTKFYELPIAPSPNLPNMKSVYWYPSLCFFEGTIVSIGRGTDLPFQCVGHPDFEVDVLEDLYRFTPASNGGSSDPKLKGEVCYGYDLSKYDVKEIREKSRLDLAYLIEFYSKIGEQENFFLSNGFINLLAGSKDLMQMIKAGRSEQEIREFWESDLESFKTIRNKYLLYEDFE